MDYRRSRSHSSTEALEARIAPASVITYTDVDGDKVKVTSSLGDLTGKLTLVDAGDGQQLQLIDLTATDFAGTDLKVTVTKVKGGDGSANIGFINASGNDLGAVNIAGDLGRIAAGDDNPDAPAIVSLSARSLGQLGDATQQAGGNLISEAKGDIGALKISRDVRQATFSIEGALGSLSIGGSLIGGSGDDTGLISVTGSIGTVTIDKNLIGGRGAFSAVIQSMDSTIGDVSIGGSFVAGPGGVAGMISASGSLGDINIGKTFRGGSGLFAGLIRSETDSIGNISIGGSFIGGSAAEAGHIKAFQNIGNVTIGGNLQGGSGSFTGTIKALNGSIENVKIGGGVFGGTANETGEIFARLNIKSLSVGGDVRGGEGDFSGNLQAEAGTMGKVTIKGDLVGGTMFRTGVVLGENGLGKVTISGSVIGGAAGETGIVLAPSGDIASVSIGGSLIGSNFTATGYVQAGGSLDSIKISGDIIGGNANPGQNVDSTGAILAEVINQVTVGGSIISGTNMSSLGRSGAIQAELSIGAITVDGSLVGNTTHGVAITALGQDEPTATEDVAIGSIKIGGDVSYARIMAGVAADFAFANGNAQIGKVTIGGDWLASSLSAGIDPGLDGQFGDDTDTVIGMGTIARIASITVKGQIFGTDVIGDHYGFVSHEIGKFKNGTISFVPTVTDPILELSPATGDVSVRVV